MPSRHTVARTARLGSRRGLRRNNYRGCRSEAGARVAALFFSLISTAKNLGLDPHAYLLAAVNKALAHQGAVLTPWDYAAQLAVDAAEVSEADEAGAGDKDSAADESSVGDGGDAVGAASKADEDSVSDKGSAAGAAAEISVSDEDSVAAEGSATEENSADEASAAGEDTAVATGGAADENSADEVSVSDKGSAADEGRVATDC